MSENGQTKKSLPGEVVQLLEDQIELATLEFEYEKSQSLRRLGALIGAGLFALCAFAFLQVAALLGLEAFGLSAGRASLTLVVVNSLLAAIILWSFGRRDPLAGEPFQGTQQEIRKNLKWIQQFFS